MKGLFTSTHCNLLLHTAKHCNILQHPATYCHILQHIAIIAHSKAARDFSLQHTAPYCYTLQNTAKYCTILQNNVKCCKILHYTATQCNNSSQQSGKGPSQTPQNSTSSTPAAMMSAKVLILLFICIWDRTHLYVGHDSFCDDERHSIDSADVHKWDNICTSAGSIAIPAQR